MTKRFSFGTVCGAVTRILTLSPQVPRVTNVLCVTRLTKSTRAILWHWFLNLLFEARQEVCIFNIFQYRFPFFFSKICNGLCSVMCCMHSGPIVHTFLPIEQIYGNWYHKILKMQTPCLVLKTSLRKGSN